MNPGGTKVPGGIRVVPDTTGGDRGAVVVPPPLLGGDQHHHHHPAGNTRRQKKSRYQYHRDHLVSTPARPGLCRRCGAAILSGLDEGVLATVDAAPLDFVAEFAAVVAGRTTFALLGDGLARRDADRISGGLVGRGVHAEHCCGS
jgi:hypothetical protein